MARGFVAESQFIASIYPGSLQPIKKFVGPSPDERSPRCTVYELEPVKRGKKPCVIEVVDSFENVLNVAESTERGNKAWTSKIVPHEQVVADLLREWAGNMVGIPAGASPGIMAIIGTVPTLAEIRTMTDMQSAFAEYQFNEGERLMLEKDFAAITQTMRDMAEWLGRKRLWSNPQALMAIEEEQRAVELSMVECPSCFKKIDTRTTVCPHCQVRLKALPPELEALNSPQLVAAP